MKANRTLSLLLFLTIGLFLSAEGLAQMSFERHHGGQGGRGPGIAKLAAELELTDEQTTKMQKQKFAIQKSAIEASSKIKIARLELHQLMNENDIDESQVKSKVEAIGKLKTELRLTVVQGKLNIHKLLTDEQKTKLKSLKRERPGMLRERGRQFRRHHFNPRERHNGGLGFEDMDLDEELAEEDWMDII